MTHLPTGEEGEEYVNPFRLEVATSGRSSRKQCKTLIASGSLRCGQVITTPDSSQFGRAIFCHAHCISAGKINSLYQRLGSPDLAEGWVALSPAQKALFVRIFDGDATALAEARQLHSVAEEADAAKAATAASKKAAKEARAAANAALGDEEPKQKKAKKQKA